MSQKRTHTSLETGLRQQSRESAFPKNFSYCGWLDIRAHKTSDWRRRYFVLSNNFLLSAETPVASQISRVIPLEGSHIRSYSTRFDITVQRKHYYFTCGSPGECSNWVMHIDKASKLKITELYRFVETLGQGPNSKVVGARHRVTGDRRAIKIVDKKKCDRHLLANEVQILKRLEHPYVVDMVDLFETKRYLYLVMERCEGGELFEFIANLDGGHYSENLCCNIMYQVAEAVRYMHSLGIVHRDLKPENILCVHRNDVTKVKLADFGISRIAQAQEQMQTLCGTLIYTAPEVLHRVPYTYRCDHWSLGVIMHILLCGYPPFVGTSDATTIHMITTDELHLTDQDWAHVSPHGKDLVRGLLNKNPNERKSVNDILDHAWIERSRDAVREESFQVFSQKFRRYMVERRLQKKSLSVLEKSSKQKGFYVQQRSRTVDDSEAGTRTPSFGQHSNKFFGYHRGSKDADFLQLRLPVNSRGSLESEGRVNSGVSSQVNTPTTIFEEPTNYGGHGSVRSRGSFSSGTGSRHTATSFPLTGEQDGVRSGGNSNSATEVA